MLKKVLRTYCKIGNISNDRHPRISGGPFNLDSRLLGNDAPRGLMMKMNIEISSKHMFSILEGSVWAR